MSISPTTYITCFCSVPFKGHKNFVKKDIIETFFTEYKKGLKTLSGDKFKSLYKPDIYYIWGKYDLCILSEIDNLEFASRFFRYSKSDDTSREKSHGEMQNFDYRVTVCFNSKLKPTGADKKLPYISIVQLKINSAFLIGNGENAIQLIKKSIITKVERFFTNNSFSYEYILSDTYSYHELTLILKSNSIIALKGVILEVRKTKFNEFDPDSDILENTLFFELINDKTATQEKIGNHIFESSLTTFGIHFDLYDKNSKLNPQIETPVTGETITFYSKWSVKPGHIQFVTSILQEVNEKFGNAYDKVELVAGKGDLLVTQRISTGNIPTNDFPKFIFSQKSGDLKKHVLETYTTVAFPLQDQTTDHLRRKQKHYHVHDKLRKYTIDPPQISVLKRKLKSLWIPKILSERILRIIANYNNAILSPDMYVFYIEIYPFINKSFIDTIDSFYEWFNPLLIGIRFYKLV